jgi:hypothetical protein
MSSFEHLKDVTEFTLCLKPLSIMSLKNVPPPLDEYFSTLSPQACIEMLRHTDFSEKREEVGAYDHHQQTYNLQRCMLRFVQKK